MQLIQHEEAIWDAIARVKARAPAFHSSYFANREQTREWVEGGLLRTVEQQDAALLLRNDGGFTRLYHAAASLEALASAVAGIQSSSTLVADVIGRREELPPIIAAYESAGFHCYGSLLRIARSGGAEDGGDDQNSIRVASGSDTARVHEFLVRLLDPLMDQVPTPEEIGRFARPGGVLIAGHPETIDGVVVFDTTGITSTLRYWYVGPGVRDRGAGGRLMRRMLWECRASRRILAWVRGGNDDAIRKYEHYGFRGDGLMDQILIRRS